ncbi:MAG: hypothetical protein IJC25_06455 [Clostridia bacterium]|nr:hypothetical protein [Clostridia bacterium]
MKKVLVFLVSFVLMIVLTLCCVSYAAVDCLSRAVKAETIDALVGSPAFEQTLKSAFDGASEQVADVEIDMNAVMNGLMESGELQRFLGDYAKAVMNALLFDEQSRIVLPQTLRQELIQSIAQQVVDVYDEKYQVGIEAVDSIKRELMRAAAEKELDQNLDAEINEVIPQPADLVQASPELTAVVRKLVPLLQPAGRIAVIAVGVVCCALIALANRRHLARALCLMGIAVLFGGAVVLVLGYLTSAAGPLMAFIGAEVVMHALIETVCGLLFASLQPIGIGCVVIAAVLFVLAAVLKATARKTVPQAA